MLELFGIEFLNDLLLPLDDVGILLMELVESSLILEQHLEESSSPFKHFIKPVVQTNLQSALVGDLFFVSVFILSIPNIVSDKLFNF
jgi:hypothetical protein